MTNRRYATLSSWIQLIATHHPSMMMMVMIVVVSIPFYDEGGRSPRDDEQWLMLVPLSRCDTALALLGRLALRRCTTVPAPTPCRLAACLDKCLPWGDPSACTPQLRPPLSAPPFSRIRGALCSPIILEGPFQACALQTYPCAHFQSHLVSDGGLPQLLPVWRPNPLRSWCRQLSF